MYVHPEIWIPPLLKPKLTPLMTSHAGTGLLHSGTTHTSLK